MTHNGILYSNKRNELLIHEISWGKSQKHVISKLHDFTNIKPKLDKTKRNQNDCGRGTTDLDEVGGNSWNDGNVIQVSRD